MLKMKIVDGKYCPIIECDWCHQQITDFRSAVAIWDLEEEVPVLEHAHKGVCHKSCEDFLHDVQPALFVELGTHLVHILWNCGLGSSESVRQAMDDASHQPQ